jgi:L-threonylcarbamoyladenylate synthase
MNDFSSTPACQATRHLTSDDAGIHEAARLLQAGGAVAIPTETVYGLAADATNPLAVAKIYAAKGRPSFNPLIIHCATRDEALALGHFDEAALALAQRFWPGALTLVVPARTDSPVCELARAGLATMAIRVPDHKIAQAIIAATGRPLAAPSANRSGHISPTSAAHVVSDLDGLIDAIVDGGHCTIGVESTIIACINRRISILRPGGLTRDQLVRSASENTEIFRQLSLSDDLMRGQNANPVAPGQLDSHYAPRAKVRLNAHAAAPNEAYLAFGPVDSSAHAHHIYNLSELGDVTEAASRFYQGLRILDQSGVSAIAVAPIPQAGLGEAINDRLRRAAFASGEDS